MLQVCIDEERKKKNARWKRIPGKRVKGKEKRRQKGREREREREKKTTTEDSGEVASVATRLFVFASEPARSHEFVCASNLVG